MYIVYIDDDTVATCLNFLELYGGSIFSEK